MALVGQWCLFLLLGTLGCVRTMPQRNNPFLINVLLTTFLSTFPPCILFITGHQEGPPPHWLCLTQSVLMDGIAPMFGIALVVLNFHTWGDMRVIIWGKTSVTRSSIFAKWILLIAPYVTLVSWCTASLVAAVKPTADVELAQFVFCSNNSHSGDIIRGNVGVFMIMCGILDLFFEFWIAWVIFAPFKFLHSQRANMSSSALYRDNVQISVRILIFSAIQLTPVLLALLNRVWTWNSLPLQRATQILESMDAIATFLVFGTQKNVLQAWNFWKPRGNLGHKEEAIGGNSVGSMV